MKKITAILLLAAMMCVIIVITQCKSNKTTETEKFTDTVITAVPLPDSIPGLAGYHFPEDSTKIYSWINKPVIDTVDVFKHAWGIWAGLTTNSGQTFKHDSLLIYQTWMGVSEINYIIQNGLTDKKSLTTKTSRVTLEVPHQLIHAKEFAKKLGGVVDSVANDNWTSVAYSPEAAAHAIKYSLMKNSAVQKYAVANKIGGIPPFPQRAMTIKPVYLVGHLKDSLIQIPVWHGPPAHSESYADTAWHSWVYLDVHNKQPATKTPVPVTSAKPTAAQIAAATINLKGNLIYFKLDSAMAAYINQQQGKVQGIQANTGDLALLVAMHVTTKEVKNWTWQTYYWAPNPANPSSPSSAVAASLRPAQITGPAAHYAMAAGYTEVAPNLPTNKLVKPVLVYNPYLEAGFGPSTFGIANKLNSKFAYGIQTNCMSCHSMATSSGNLPYTTDQYINMKDTLFKNQVQLDFAWSIQQALSVDPALAKAKKK